MPVILGWKHLLHLLTLSVCLPQLAVGLTPSAQDSELNGRWDIMVENEGRRPAWWLKIEGAGTPHVRAGFVGAPGGRLDDIQNLKINDGVLEFFFDRAYRVPGQQKPLRARGVYRGRLVNGRLEGEHWIEGSSVRFRWVGVRAPEIKDHPSQGWKPQNPIELFNGRDLSGWRPLWAPPTGSDFGWRVSNGILANAPPAPDIATDQRFWNFRLQVEYRLQRHSNSGIGLRGRYEVQLLDDYGRPPSDKGNAAIYSRIAPALNASKPAGEWQQLDVTLIGRFVTVILNGVKVIDQKEIEGLTAMACDPNEGEPGPISLQGDHGLVEFRRLTLTPLVR